MSIQLTTPAEGGVLVDGATFTHAKIVHWEHDLEQGSAHLTVAFGNVDGEGSFVPAANRAMRKLIHIEGQDYLDLVAVASTLDGELFYAAGKRILNQWVIDNAGLGGVVV